MSWIFNRPQQYGDYHFVTESACYQSAESRGYPTVRQGFSGGAQCIEDVPYVPLPPPEEEYSSGVKCKEGYAQRGGVGPCLIIGGAIPDLPEQPLDQVGSDGSTAACPRGEKYTDVWSLTPFAGLVPCDPGYSRMGIGCGCDTKIKADIKEVAGTALSPLTESMAGLAGIMQMLPYIIIALIGINLIGAFRK